VSTDDVVDPSNEAMRDAWDGDTGAFWADNADRFDAGLSGYHEPLLDAAALTPTDVVLDVGCGAGRLTRDAARQGHSALGVDLSSRLLDLARRRAEAEGLANVAFRQADAAVHPFGDAAFDVLLSRQGVMFFGDPPAAFAHLARAVRPGGRLALLTWQGLEHQEWMRRFRGVLDAERNLPDPPSDGPGPFGLSDPDRVRALLEGAGFADVTLDDLRRPMPFGADPDDALGHVAGLQSGLLQDLDEPTRRRVLADLRDDLAAHDTGHGVEYASATWLVRARRR
jgi:SAM-dependent methyltransferase